MSAANKQHADFLEYMKTHKLEHLFEHLTSELAQVQPKEPIDFLLSKLQKVKDEGLSHDFRKVVFVLGGPGSGKGTACARLFNEHKMQHYSAGDLLREEAKEDTEEGHMIAECIKEGKIVPGHITIRLLRKAIMKHPDKECYFLVDGFPREMKQALDFEREICPCQFVLFFECPFDALEKRLLARGETSGRVDDNIATIKKRFETYQKQTLPVIEYFGAKSKVRHVDASQSIEQTFNQVMNYFKDNEKQK